MSSPPSPMKHKRTDGVLPGFRPSPRTRRPIADMTIRELQDLHKMNARILSSPGASTSTYVERVTQEQKAIESRLLDFDIAENLNASMRHTQIKGEGDMDVDPEPPVSRTIEAKRRALAHYSASARKQAMESNSGPSDFTLQDAMELEHQAFVQERERQQRLLEKKRRQGLPIRGEVLSREEQEARLWRFLTYKPSESDMEDDDDDEDDDDSDADDPASWFEDDQDDGIKGQDIVEPDMVDELSNIIKVDQSRIPYSGLYPS